MKSFFLLFRLTAAAILLAAAIPASAEVKIETEATFYGGFGSGEFAPYLISSNQYGKFTQSKNALLDLRAEKHLDLSRRFDWSAGVEAIGGYTSSADYIQAIPDGNPYAVNPQHPARVWIQQLYAQVKWRSLYLSVGMKDRPSSYVDQRLSSGDLIWSGNSRAIPEVRLGFVDFQDIPLLKHALQIDLQISYGKFMDTDFTLNHYNKNSWSVRNSGPISTGNLWTYKRINFRTKPTNRLVGTFGIQMTGIFGGVTSYYDKGVEIHKDGYPMHNYNGFSDFFFMLFPVNRDNHEGYKIGDHKGSYDFALSYRFRNDSKLRGYVQWFWEDGTGMSKSNGFDGLWGLEYSFGKNFPWVRKVLAEYLEFMHQGGPILYAPGYDNGSLPHPAVGGDNYYNNAFYRSYVNYGMTMGSSMTMGTIYNLDGNPIIPYNRVRGFHIAAEGAITPDIDWIFKYSYRKAWGQPFTLQQLAPLHANSVMAGIDWRIPQVKGLSLSAKVSLDRGNMPQNAFGCLIGLSYSTLNLGIPSKK